MVVQPQLLMLEKTLVYVESMGRYLYPQLNLWQTALPFLQNWYLEEFSYRTQAKNIAQNLPEVINSINQLPDYIYRFQENQQNQLRELQNLQQRVNSLHRGLGFALVSILLLVLILIFK